MSSAPQLSDLNWANSAVFEEFLNSRQEPAWLADRRRLAFGAWQRLIEEELDPEEWKRLDMRAFRPDRFHRITSPEAAVIPTTTLQDKTSFGGVVQHVDGTCVRSELSEELAAQGVLFGSLAKLSVSHPALVESYLSTRAVLPESDRFAAWHAAYWNDGTFLYVPKGVEVKVPLHSLISLNAEGAADFSHTLVVLEEGASATLLEETTSATATASGLHIGAVELLLGRGARLRYVQLQNWNDKVWHIARQVGRVSSEAFLQWTVSGLGGRFAHIHQDVHLDGRGAEAQVNGVTFATGRQVISYYTQQWHNAQQTRSDLLYKDVLRDRSRVVWRGMIKVAPGAQQTDGYQRNDGLLLSDESRADAIPGLEIEADDVRCTHGATVGRVDEEMVFYCMSRGMGRSEAMHMIVEGFLQTVLDRIPVEVVRDSLGLAVAKKLGLGD